MNYLILSEISLHGGGDFTHNIFALFIWILIGLILWGAGKYAFPKFGMPAKGLMIWDGLFLLIAMVVVINFLAGLTGHPLFTW